MDTAADSGVTTGGPLRLVGREPELEALRQFVSSAAGGGGGSLLVTGEAGVGKSALLDAASGFATALNIRVVRAAGVEFEADISFAGLHQLLRPLLGALPELSDAYRAALVVALGIQPGPAPDRLLLSSAVLELLVRSAVDLPLLLVIDDMQWLDTASVTQIGMIARRLANTRVGLLGAVRSGEASPVESSGFAELSVSPLDIASAATLLSTTFPDLSSRDRTRTIEMAEGNPLALIELPPATAGDLPRPAFSGSNPVGRRLRAHFVQQIGTLPADTRDALLRAALDSEVPITIDVLAPAEQLRLVRVELGGSHVRFRHPLVRAAVVEIASSEQRRAAHRALADLWPEGSGRRVWHLADAAVGPDEHISSALERASKETRDRGDPVGSMQLLLRAASLSPSRNDRDRRTRLAAFLGIDVTGDIAQIRRILAGVAEGSEHTLDAVVPSAAAMIQAAGDLDTVHALLVAAIAEVPDQTDSTDQTLIEALYLLENAAFFASRAGLGDAFHDMLARLAPEPPEQLVLLGSTFLDPARRALPMLDRLDTAVARIGTTANPADVARLSMAAVYVDRTAACRDALWRVIEHGRSGGAITSAIEAFTLLACDALLTGGWDQALEIAAEGLALTEHHQYPLLGGILHYSVGAVAALRGDLDDANQIAGAMIGWAAPNRIGFITQLATHVQALAALSHGRYDDAYELALRVCTIDTVPANTPNSLWVLPDLVESAVRAGRVSEARRHVDHIAEARLAELSPRLAFVAAGAEAMISSDESFRQRFDAALVHPDTDRWPFHQARLQLAYGERLRRSKSIRDARQHLGFALSTFERLRAAPWIERATHELRASGESVSGHLSRSADTLTPQQLEIARLAAAGLTNKQIGERLFLSPRTVSTHLYQLFPKLGVTSRAALRDALDHLSPPA